MAARRMLEEGRVDPMAIDKMNAFHDDVIKEVERTLVANEVVVVGMSGNPHVKNVKKMLEAAGINYHYLEYGSYFSQWKTRLAIKLWTGWPTFPQVFVKGMLIGGADLTKAAIDSGELARKLGLATAS